MRIGVHRNAFQAVHNRNDFRSFDTIHIAVASHVAMELCKSEAELGGVRGPEKPTLGTRKRSAT